VHDTQKEIVMKKLLATLALGMFITGGLVGCEASAHVDADHDHGTDTSYKKTTTVQPDGDRVTKTEIRRD